MKKYDWTMKPLDYWDEEANEFLKTRKGLRALLAENTGNTPVVEAIRLVHMDWNWPLCLLP